MLVFCAKTGKKQSSYVAIFQVDLLEWCQCVYFDWWQFGLVLKHWFNLVSTRISTVYLGHLSLPIPLWSGVVHTRELHGNGDDSNTAVIAGILIPAVLPVNLAITPWGRSCLWRGYRRNGTGYQW